MNKYTSDISLLFGGMGLVFIGFAAFETVCDCLLPSLIFVLFHMVMVFVAFPFFLYTIFYHEKISRTYFWTVAIMSIINAFMMMIVSSIDPDLTGLFYVASYLEFLPLPFLMTVRTRISDKFEMASIDEINLPIKS